MKSPLSIFGGVMALFVVGVFVVDFLMQVAARVVQLITATHATIMIGVVLAMVYSLAYAAIGALKPRRQSVRLLGDGGGSPTPVAGYLPDSGDVGQWRPAQEYVTDFFGEDVDL